MITAVEAKQKTLDAKRANGEGIVDEELLNAYRKVVEYNINKYAKLGKKETTWFEVAVETLQVLQKELVDNGYDVESNENGFVCVKW